MSTDLQNKRHRNLMSTRMQKCKGFVLIFRITIIYETPIKHNTFTFLVFVGKEVAGFKRSNQFVLAEQFIDPLAIKDQTQIP